MSNEKNVDEIHAELLENISDNYQKSEGFPVWDILRAFAYGLKRLWDKVFDVEAQLDVDNMTGNDLDRFVFQRKGLTRKPANKSVAVLKIVTGEGTINAGDLFATANYIRFEAIETKSVVANDTIAVQAVVAGASGNVAANTITQMPVTITGIAEVTNDNPAVDGYDAENDDALRDRYYEALQEPATSGNVYHYKRWAKEVSGVGDAKVFGLWAGDNTVQVVIIDSDKKVPSAETVARCQEYIDPEIAGSGEGQAPVGAYCTVTAATALNVNIETTLDYDGDETIIRNIRIVAGHCQKIYARYPLIASRTTEDTHLKRFASIMEATGITEVEIMRCNPNMELFYTLSGIPCKLEQASSIPTDRQFQKACDFFESRHITVKK